MRNGEQEQEKSFNPLAVMSREELDVQIATAKKFPRSIVAFKRQAEEMATLDEETAASMFYVLPRAGKRIEGPSVRLAEIVGSAWGNVRYDGRVVEVQEHYVVAQGTCLDLERNTGARIESRRRITNREGKRYDDDMIGVTANAAVSIALRTSIFKVVPFAYVKPIYEKCKEVSLGKALSMEQRRNRALEWFTKIGAKQEDLFRVLERKGVEDITVDDLIALQGMKNAIMDGETSWEAILRDFNAATEEPEKKQGPALSKLKESLRENRSGQQTEAKETPVPQATTETVAEPQVEGAGQPVTGQTPVDALIAEIQAIETDIQLTEFHHQINKKLKAAGIKDEAGIQKISNALNEKRTALEKV